MPFALILLLFFLAELGVMSAVADSAGFWGVLGLLFLGFMAGGYLINRQGSSASGRFAAGGAQAGPGSALNVLFNLLAGLLFIFPGFISDALALLLLLPPLRLLLIGLAGHLLLTRLAPRMGRMQAFTFGRRYGGAGTGGFGTGETNSNRFGAGSFGTGGTGNGGRTEGFGDNYAGSANQSRSSNPPHTQGVEEIVIEGEFRDVTAEARQPEKICPEKEPE